MHSSKFLYVIAGCNGAGETTASYTILPEILQCREFVNADEIAKGLSPFQPQEVSVQAGRIMISRIDYLITNGLTFAFETTLSSKLHTHTILKAKEHGYQVVLLYFWLQNVELVISRVRNRVLEGGHDIAIDIIRRRYKRGISNLFKLYIPIVDLCYLIDNSSGEPSFIAEFCGTNDYSIHEFAKFEYIKSTV